MAVDLTREEYDEYRENLQDTVIAFWNQRDESHLKEHITRLWESGVPSRDIKRQIDHIVVSMDRSCRGCEFDIAPSYNRNIVTPHSRDNRSRCTTFCGS